MFSRKTRVGMIIIILFACILLMISCDVSLGPCSEIDCGEHGTCVDGACVCSPGYSGDFCLCTANLDEEKYGMPASTKSNHQEVAYRYTNYPMCEFKVIEGLSVR